MIHTTGKNGTFRMDPQELFKVSDVKKWLIADTLTPGNSLITRKAKATMSDIDAATKIVHESTALFSAAFDAMTAQQANIAEQSKKVSGSVRDAQQKLSDGLERMTKTADFPRLEKYVLMLERAAAAMQILAELDKTGHLAKFSQAMK